MLCIFVLGVGSQYSAEAVVVDLVFVGHHEFTPLLLSLGALHFVLDDGLGRVEVRESLTEVFVYVVVYLGQAQGAAPDLLEDGPVGLEVFDGCDGMVRKTETQRAWLSPYP